MTLENTIIYLLGYPGTGKYTIGKEIRRQYSEFRLVGNQLINNPLFSIINADGITPLPKKIWKNVGIIWDAVLDTMINISPKEFSFVMTNALFKSEEEIAWYHEVALMATTGQSCFVPVVLTISLEEHQKRITTQERKDGFKDINPDLPAKCAQENNLFIPNHTNLLMLDVSEVSPEISAQRIIAHVNEIKSKL